MLKKDFATKYFLEVLRTNPPSIINHYVADFNSWACHHLPMKVLKQNNTLEKFITNAEAYLEPVKYLRWNFLALLFLPKSSIIDFRLGSKYASVMREDIWKVAFSKILKISQEKTVLDYNFSKVVGLTYKFIIKLQSTVEVFLWNFWKFLEKYFLNSFWADWKRSSWGVLEKKIKFA